MEELFDFLPGLVILFALLSSILKKVKKFLTNLEDEVNEKYGGDQTASKEFTSSLKPKEAGTDGAKETVAQTEQREEAADSNKKRKKRKNISSKSNNKSSKSKAKDKIKATEGKIISSSDFNQKEIRKGILFKEILSEPRAKRPHSFFNSQE